MAQDEVFKALADATRRRMLVVLGGGEKRVVDIAEGFDISRPAISKHLSVLERAGLVTMRRDGRDHFHSIVPDALREAAGYVQEVEGSWAEKMQRSGERLR